jgi:hypothetical protein
MVVDMEQVWGQQDQMEQVQLKVGLEEQQTEESLRVAEEELEEPAELGLVQ